MRQFQFAYTDDNDLRSRLIEIRRDNDSYAAKFLFHVYSETTDQQKLDQICHIIEHTIPESFCVGSTSNGNILDGNFSSAEIIVTCSVFEHATTKIEVLQYKLNSDTAESVAQKLIDQVEQKTWVKAVELLVTMRGMSMTDFCNEMQDLREDVQVFGGGAFNPDINNDESLVFSGEGKCSSKSGVFILYGGEELNVYSTAVTGWIPLGPSFQVTRADGAKLYELDGKPAYEAYYKYLNIPNDENFFHNTLEFPFYYMLNGINILRAPIACNSDGSLTMTSDMAENVTAKIAYGDPQTILSKVYELGQRVKGFKPQTIQIFSCGARRKFWGEADVGKESLPFQSMAPTSGFYTSGEFLRTGDCLNQHNVTMVIVAMREGVPCKDECADLNVPELDFSGKISMINRLATFIDSATSDLEASNRVLHSLMEHDSLTSLYKRDWVEKRVEEACETGSSFSLILVNIRQMKKINCEFGRKIGDAVIRKVANQIQHVLFSMTGDGLCGRWNGDEFLVFLPGLESSKVLQLSEKLERSIGEMSIPQVGTISVNMGIAERKNKESLDSLLASLYSA